MSRPVVKKGQAKPVDGRRRNTTGSWPTVASQTTHAKLAEKQKSGDTTGLRATYENEASQTNGWYVGVKCQRHIQSRGPKTGQVENLTQRMPEKIILHRESTELWQVVPFSKR